ncbi:uncharacterized protein M421DRAFT_70754 [Didymella exigua CBS 183.55]|uniref:Uncharacterized protein n=1 Tax=Didymella exigua CBS 183.55 TaxID=1150837 RepID=A0A6A5RCC2_9PLEO|nr:uncharacterized protein M421DRAFT_70754 [Didymella exigua CBS 183.55]KAF1925153.1 hypothetical protein M421DRAFT_70754 [Didymella exigua CBS 183.55]
MLAATSTEIFRQPSKHDTAKKWLHRRLWKPASRQLLRTDNDGGLRRKLSLKRPQTAPTSGRVTPEVIAPVPQIPINMELPSPRLVLHAPPRPPRPDSGVMRDVNAWLDASMSSPPPPLMGGLPYWRSASAVPATYSTGMQYAIPIVREPGTSRPMTPSGQQVKLYCRRGAKKVQAKMPSLLRTASQRIVARKQINRRSNSMPLFAIPYEQTQQGPPPKMLTRSRSFLLSSARRSLSKCPAEEQGLLDHGSFDLPVLGSTRTSIAYSGLERSGERHMHGLLGHGTKSGSRTRPSTAGGRLGRDESLGDLSLSEAPTYSSGRPPPSYRSRTASIMTTSSFGCVDGMGPAQRQISQQRAGVRSRGVRGRVRELRKRFQNE